MLTPSDVRELIRPFYPALTDEQAAQVKAYLDLLMKWNEKINLTAIRDERECITRNFGESLFLAGMFSLYGRLLDVGSGAGFPGLAIKIVAPDTAVTLLEPNGKKRAFLGEVARVCELREVEVRSERFEEFTPNEKFNAITCRALGGFEEFDLKIAEVLEPGGRIYLWTTVSKQRDVNQSPSHFRWAGSVAIPESEQELIRVGVSNSAVKKKP